MACYSTDDEIAELWDRCMRGETSNALARRLGKSSASMSRRIQASGGIRRAMPTGRPAI
jgi:hypothetical protein